METFLEGETQLGLEVQADRQRAVNLQSGSSHCSEQQGKMTMGKPFGEIPPSHPLLSSVLGDPSSPGVGA